MGTFANVAKPRDYPFFLFPGVGDYACIYDMELNDITNVKILKTMIVPLPKNVKLQADVNGEEIPKHAPYMHVI